MPNTAPVVRCMSLGFVRRNRWPGCMSCLGTTGTEPCLQIDPGLIRCQTCVSAYIGAAFLCSGTVTDPQKEYNLEFLTARTNLAKDFEALLAEHEFAPHRTRRAGVNLIYVKAGDNVEKLLSFMGAVQAAQQIHDQKAVKQVRNQINRHTNCDTANLGKSARPVPRHCGPSAICSSTMR